MGLLDAVRRQLPPITDRTLSDWADQARKDGETIKQLEKRVKRLNAEKRVLREEIRQLRNRLGEVELD